ncbi:MAG TPA: hypothetical protein VFQ23_23475 [Anaerolineales bacterium]|nr:hypothetical protein [Anaerolineales bacterium]
MIDVAQLPILLKAIDFIFDEGRKILEERRERRKAEAALQETQNPEPAEEAAPVEEQEPAEVKQELVSSKIDEIVWKDHEAEVKHLVKLLETYSHNYHLAKEQYAKWGSALVPPIILHNMTEAENSMLETIQKLEGVLSKVYKKEINPVK